MQEADIHKMSHAEREDAVNEIRLLASIRHENICRYHEAFLDGNYLCIVMEFAPNGDLSRFVRKGQEFNKVRAAAAYCRTLPDTVFMRPRPCMSLITVVDRCEFLLACADIPGRPDMEVSDRCEGCYCVLSRQHVRRSAYWHVCGEPDLVIVFHYLLLHRDLPGALRSAHEQDPAPGHQSCKHLCWREGLHQGAALPIYGHVLRFVHP